MGKGPSIPERLQEASTSPWELAVGLLGLAALVGIIGYMTWFALSTRSDVPDITVRKIEIQRSGDFYVVQFEAGNDSAATAAALKIEGELRRGGTVIETSETEIDYLPPYSRRKAGLFFQEDPTRYELKLLPKGYDTP